MLDLEGVRSFGWELPQLFHRFWVVLRTGGRKRDPAKVANLVENHFQITIIITNAVLKKASVYIV